MKRYILTALLAFAFGIEQMLLTATPSMAVHKNYNNQLTCGECHTMHNSEGNASMGGNIGGSIVLLRGIMGARNAIHNFCLQCHASNGAQATTPFGTDNHHAPKVYIDGQGGAGNSATPGTLDDFSKIGAGGDFSADLTGNSTGWTDLTTVALGKAHSLGLSAGVPPGSADGTDISSVGGFSCLNCHDPHGAYNTAIAVSNVYRNLRIRATGAGSNAGVTLNTGIRSYLGTGGDPDGNWDGDATAGVDRTLWPLYATTAVFDGTEGCGANTGGGRTNCYPVGAAGNIDATDGISNWCAQCHDNWHENLAAANNVSGNDWLRHPVDNVIDDGTPSGDGVSITDTTTYFAPYNTGLNRVPMAKSTSAAFPVAYLTSGDEANSRVFCLSCHFAHGGPYYDNLRWYYASAVSVGDQDGNAIASNVGCQQCHNR